MVVNLGVPVCDFVDDVMYFSSFAFCFIPVCISFRKGPRMNPN